MNSHTIRLLCNDYDMHYYVYDGYLKMSTYLKIRQSPIMKFRCDVHSRSWSKLLEK